VENGAFGFHLPFESGIVLDDAVVNDGDEAVAADVGVGVAVVGRAVRGPAGVADADAAGGGLVAEGADEVVNPACPFAKVQPGAGERGQAGAVLTAVLQPPQASYYIGFRFLAAVVTDDSALGASSIKKRPPVLSARRMGESIPFRPGPASPPVSAAAPGLPRPVSLALDARI
jgi:hypothetical protein